MLEKVLEKTEEDNGRRLLLYFDAGGSGLTFNASITLLVHISTVHQGARIVILHSHKTAIV